MNAGFWVLAFCGWFCMCASQWYDIFSKLRLGVFTQLLYDDNAGTVNYFGNVPLYLTQYKGFKKYLCSFSKYLDKTSSKVTWNYFVFAARFWSTDSTFLLVITFSDTIFLWFTHLICCLMLVTYLFFLFYNYQSKIIHRPHLFCISLEFILMFPLLIFII